MNMLLQKSKDNLAAGDLLIQNNHFTSSIHCLYYGNVQLMRYILINVFSIEECDLSDAAKSDYKTTHDFAIKKIIEDLNKRNEKIKLVDFKKNIGKLKGMRVDSDYYSVAITFEMSNEAKRLAILNNELLSKVYEIK